MTGDARQAAMTHACEPLETRIRRFPRNYRRRLRKLVRGSKPMTDLLYSFPAVVFALAAGKRAPEASGHAMALIRTGASLPEVAAALGLPLWSRRLPPEAFARPLDALPDDEHFNRRIVNLLPAGTRNASAWLQGVTLGTEACSSGFALWLAGTRVAMSESGEDLPLLPLAAFAWFSRHKGEMAHALIQSPWHNKMRFNRAVWEARAWLERLAVEYCLEDDLRNGSWQKPRKACGYRFVPLRSGEELREEGDRMHNCVGGYAGKVASGACLIYSIRRGGKRVATMEVIPIAAKRAARIAQLLGPENYEVTEEVRRAARAWLARRGSYPLAEGGRMADIPIRAGRWEAVWQSYCAAKPRFGAQLLAQPSRALRRLDEDLCELQNWKEPN